jgi:hypothetical protein
MTLGCGGYGGNITSDNISPRHLLNVKRLAYETTPAVIRKDVPAPVGTSAAPLPKAAAAAAPQGLAADSLARRIDQFLVTKGYTPPAAAVAETPKVAPAAQSPVPPVVSEKAADFVCEEDVRQALKQGRKIVIGERSIVTPAARDLGEQHKLFVELGLRR